MVEHTKTQFDPELHLEPQEQAALAILTSQPGWAVVHKIARWGVDQYVVALINTASGNDAAVVEGHRVSKTAGSLYQTITNRINLEVEAYTGGRKPEGPPVDITEGMIDLGPQASTQYDLDALEEEPF